MKYLYLTAFMIVALMNTSQAQYIGATVFANAGGFGKSGGYNLDFTFGEIVSELLVNGDINLQQGFQQYKLQHVGVYTNSPELQGVNLYPNPASTQLTLDNQTGETIQVKVLGIDGKVNDQLQYANGTHSLDISSWIAGTYIMQLVKNSEVKTYKIEKY